MKGDGKIGKLFKARENTSVYGTNGFSFTSQHLIGKPNQDISELFSALNFKIASTEKDWYQRWQDGQEKIRARIRLSTKSCQNLSLM